MWNKLFVIICILGLSVEVYALRITKPPRLIHPLTEEQVINLNNSIEDLWNISNGRLQLDIVTTTKALPSNGEVWIFNDSGTYKLEFRANDTTHTITP